MEKYIRQKNLISSTSLLILGLIYALLALRLPLWSSTGPQEGFFPLAIAALMIGMSLLILGKSLVSTPTQTKEKGSEGPQDEGVNVFRVISYGLWMGLYALFFEKVGFLITSTFFLFVILKYTEKQTWKMAIWVGSASILSSYLLFVYFLGVPLPKGLLKW